MWFPQSTEVLEHSILIDLETTNAASFFFKEVQWCFVRLQFWTRTAPESNPRTARNKGGIKMAWYCLDASKIIPDIDVLTSHIIDLLKTFPCTVVYPSLRMVNGRRKYSMLGQATVAVTKTVILQNTSSWKTSLDLGDNRCLYDVRFFEENSSIWTSE